MTPLGTPSARAPRRAFLPTLALALCAGLLATLGVTAPRADATSLISCSYNGHLHGTMKEYSCGWTTPTPVIDRYNARVGSFASSTSNWVLCQQASSVVYTRGSYHNAWWALTIADNGALGWVNGTWATSGSDYQKFANVPSCGGNHGPVPTLASGGGKPKSVTIAPADWKYVRGAAVQAGTPIGSSLHLATDTDYVVGSTAAAWAATSTGSGSNPEAGTPLSKVATFLNSWRGHSIKLCWRYASSYQYSLNDTGIDWEFHTPFASDTVGIAGTSYGSAGKSVCSDTFHVGSSLATAQLDLVFSAASGSHTLNGHYYLGNVSLTQVS